MDAKGRWNGPSFVEVDMAVEQFAKLQKLDPYRLENMDTYSNLLYVKVCILLHY